MPTKPIPTDLRTARRWVRAYVALGADPYKDTARRLERLDRLALAMSHWYTDDLEDWGCSCDACQWWKEQVHRHVDARN